VWRDWGFRDAKDVPIFHAAREAGAVIMRKDSDFVLLLERFGPPPQILWVTCGTTSNARRRDVLRKSFPEARARLEQGEPLVEISDAR
jgi:predicted nuclease of predicted toxin-antitoxin system